MPVSARARSPRARTSATAPSPGEQNMYCVSGWLTILEASTSASDRGRRRQALGLRAPFSNAFSATLASVEARLTVADPERLRIGMPMELVLLPAPGGDGALTYAFRPVEQA